MASNYTPETWATAVLGKLGFPASRGAVQALVGWAKAEGGNWNNDAKYNPLNTTQPMPGAGNTGSQGNIKVYKSWQQGIDATVKTLLNGNYNTILAGLHHGNAGLTAKAIGASPWGTAGGLVESAIMGTRITHVPTATAAPSSRSSAVSALTTTTPGSLGTDNSARRRQLIGDFLSQGGVRSQQATLQLASGWQGAQDVPGTQSSTTTTSTSSAPSMVATPGSGVSPRAKAGDPVVSGKQSEGGLHDTEGLAGYPAHDFFAPSGTHAVAPVSGTVFKLSGHDPAQGPVEGPHGPLGWSVYIKGTDGRNYFLTHMGSRNVKVGQSVKQGQVIGTVADYAKYGTPSHIHMGVEG